jgi:hypothetical protein
MERCFLQPSWEVRLQVALDHLYRRAGVPKDTDKTISERSAHSEALR